MLASVYSIFMKNIHPDVVANQKLVVDRFLPDGWSFKQYLHTPQLGEEYNHATALERCLSENKNPITVFLDIDCIPLSQQAFERLAKHAKEGALVGAAQRANHINNNAHLYVGPFCMAFLNEQYKELGSPSFRETPRGDCAEELSYRWEEKEQDIQLMWPSDIYYPAWNLTNSLKFGYGTTYDDLFYHAFAIRQGEMQEQFITKCQEIIRTSEPKKPVQTSQEEVVPAKIQPKERK